MNYSTNFRFELSLLLLSSFKCLLSVSDSQKLDQSHIWSHFVLNTCGFILLCYKWDCNDKMHMKMENVCIMYTISHSKIILI